MNNQQMSFFLRDLKKFCLDRSIFILKDFKQIPFVSGRAKFAQNAQARFDIEAAKFIELNEFPFKVDIYVDNVNNIERFIPSVCIAIVGGYSFLVYDIFLDRFYQYINGYLFIDDAQTTTTENKYDPSPYNAADNPSLTDSQYILSPTAQICYYLAGFSKKPAIANDHYLVQFLQKFKADW